jgi:hypothetical protein
MRSISKKIQRYQSKFIWTVIWSVSLLLFVNEIESPVVQDVLRSTVEDGFSIPTISLPFSKSLVSKPTGRLTRVARSSERRERPSERYCSEKEYLEGAWVERDEPLTNFDEVRKAYQFTVSRTVGSFSPANVPNISPHPPTLSLSLARAFGPRSALDRIPSNSNAKR